MQPLDYCRQKAAESRSSFLAAFRFLPQRRQDAMTVLYAFCRELDDVVDDCTDMQVAQTTLNWWRADLAKVFDGGAPEHPVCRALQGVVAEFALPHDELAEIIEGMQMDLTRARYANFAELQLYCHRVAGVVGRLITRILGFSRPETLNYADKMGLALQLTNIIRDVGEDARRGRIYLPVEDLEQFNVPAADILACRESDAFAALMAFQIDRAEQFYRQAFAHLPVADRKAQRPGLMMAAIYRTTLDEIRRDGAQKVLNQRTSLTPIRKLWLAWKTWVSGKPPV